MKAPNGGFSGNGSAQARRHGGAFGAVTQIFFVPPKVLLCSEKFVLTYDKNKIFPQKNVFPKP